MMKITDARPGQAAEVHCHGVGECGMDGLVGNQMSQDRSCSQAKFHMGYLPVWFGVKAARDGMSLVLLEVSAC